MIDIFFYFNNKFVPMTKAYILKKKQLLQEHLSITAHYLILREKHQPLHPTPKPDCFIETIDIIERHNLPIKLFEPKSIYIVVVQYEFDFRLLATYINELRRKISTARWFMKIHFQLKCTNLPLVPISVVNLMYLHFYITTCVRRYVYTTHGWNWLFIDWSYRSFFFISQTKNNLQRIRTHIS